MATTFAEKFEQALQDRKVEDPEFGLRTVARILAKDERAKIETIRRRLNKYRPKNGGGAAKIIVPTEPTRREIEDALGLERDALRPEPVEAPDKMVAELIGVLSRYVDHRIKTAAGS